MLYLADQEPSLQAVLEIIERLGKFSGLRINWDKSQILPLNQSPPPQYILNYLLTRVSTIKYLGVVVTRDLGIIVLLT